MASVMTSIGAGAVLLLASGCTFHNSTEAKSLPPRSTYQAASSSLKVIRIDAGTAERAEAIERALEVTLEILASKDFQTALNKEHLSRGPTSELEAIGEEVATFLVKKLPASVTFLERPQGFWGFWGLGSTTATTDQASGVVSIASFRVDEWIEGRSGLLVNTLAHELTHLDASYVDGDRKYCQEASLVSYRVGDLAQCFYEAQGELAEFKRCASAMTNGAPDRAERLKECRDPADG
jgi:hypothetical protein